MRTQSIKPWLDQNGLPLSEDQLKVVSEHWDQKTWESYLSWFECPLKESQLKNKTFSEMADKMEESIFSLVSNEEDHDTKICIDELLALLTPKQRIAIEMIYWQGRSEREIAQHLGVSRSTIYDAKKSALAKIKKNINQINYNMKFDAA